MTQKTTTLTISTWGTMRLGPIRVRVRADERAQDAVRRSIARRTGYACATWRSEGWRQEHGQAVAAHYAATMGRPMRGGGYSVQGEIWCEIPI